MSDNGFPLASRRQRKLILQTMGFSSMREFWINTTTQAGTVIRIATWLETIRGVRSVRFGRGAPGVVTPLLTMRWWAWLTLGWLHRRALRQATAIVRREKPAGADYSIAFEP